MSQGGSRGGASSILSGGDQVNLSDTLRFGARNFGRVVQQINGVAESVNLIGSTLEGLSGLVSEAQELAEEASRPSLSSSRRRSLDRLFQEVASQFRAISDASSENKIGDNELFSEAGLTELFQFSGLDPEESRGIGELFEQLALDFDETFWSDAVDSSDPIAAFGGSLDLRSSRSSKTVLEQLNELSDRFEQNLSFVEQAREVVTDNLELARAAGFAFLEVSEQLTDGSEADQVAQDLVKRIRSSARQALSQAENLELMTIAALTDDDSSGS